MAEPSFSFDAPSEAEAAAEARVGCRSSGVVEPSTNFAAPEFRVAAPEVQGCRTTPAYPPSASCFCASTSWVVPSERGDRAVLQLEGHRRSTVAEPSLELNNRIPSQLDRAGVHLLCAAGLLPIFR